MRDIVLDKLSVYEDTKFKFDPIQHKYTYEEEHFISVTQFISKFHKKFEGDFWAQEKAAERGISKEEVLLEWKQINERSNFIGSSTHNWIENYFRGNHQVIPQDLDIIDRINKFNLAHYKWLSKLTPIIFEQRIFSKKWKIAGMLDALFSYNNSIIILDYKTNKKFTHDQHPMGKFEKLLIPFDNFYKNYLNEYSIQVSLYKLILKEIGIDVKSSYLLHIGPDTEAQMYRAHDFSDILENYLNLTICN